MWENWIIDATMGWPPCFCPIEGDLDGEYSIVVGMNLDKPQGKLVGIVHADGQEAVDAFCEKYKNELTEMYGKIL